MKYRWLLLILLFTLGCATRQDVRKYYTYDTNEGQKAFCVKFDYGSRIITKYIPLENVYFDVDEEKEEYVVYGNDDHYLHLHKSEKEKY